MLRGPGLLVAISLAIGAMCAALALAISPVPAAAGAVIRWTARTSLVLFALTYVARPLVQLAPAPATKALLAQRKWLGLGFAASHGFHLLGILWLASPDVAAFVRSQEPTTLVATATFVALALMTVTSIESLKRKLPARTWRASTSPACTSPGSPSPTLARSPPRRSTRCPSPSSSPSPPSASPPGAASAAAPAPALASPRSPAPAARHSQYSSTGRHGSVPQAARHAAMA